MTGEIAYNLGKRKPSKAWEEAKQNEGSGDPHCGGSTPRVTWLRDSLENSNYILLKIPIEIHNLGHGEWLTSTNGERLPEELAVTDQDFRSLSPAGLIRRQPLKASRMYHRDCNELLTFMHS
jgi:hypothetical protein